MSLSDSDLPVELLSNPINVQKTVLDDVHDRLRGTHAIVDPNNVAMYLIEIMSTLTANHASAMEQAIASQNALRAQTSQELAKHMSDYDYVSMYSSPASTYLILTLDKKYLEDNALDYNTNYKKVVIPKDTVFVIGDLVFGMYYPIEIRINKATSAPLVVFDTSEENPLHELNQNIVQFTEQEILKTKCLYMKIPVYQFARSVITEDMIPGRGFSKKYKHNDKFYAVRLFTEVNGKKIELSQSLAVDTYDPTTPTARLQIIPETQEFSINIPQIYFTSGKIGAQLTVELFVTKGAIDVDISTAPTESILCKFNTSQSGSAFAKILDTVPTVILAPTTAKVTGGSDGLTFEEKRTRVINNTFHTTVLVTPKDMEAYFADTGFSAVRYKDNLTNLIYFAYKVLTDKTKSVIPAMTSHIELSETTPNTVSTIIKNDDETITVLPSTIFAYRESTNTCIPLEDSEVQRIAQLTKKELISEFNSSSYMKTPFHLRLIPDGRYSKVASYNLLDPELEDIRFERENSNITAQMVATAGTIHHSNGGTGGYRVQFLVSKSADLANVPEEDLFVYLYTEDIDGTLVGVQLEYAGVLESDTLYEASLGTDYHISRNHQLNVTTLKDHTTTWNHFVDLKGTYTLVFMVKNEYFPTAVTDLSLYQGVDPDLQSTHMVMLRQSCSLTLGYSLEDVVYNDINLSWSGKVYARHPIDEQLTYDQDIYETDSTGAPIVIVDEVTGEVTIPVKHAMGDLVYDDIGQPVYAHRAGDIRYDNSGEPIVLTDRVQIYYVNATMVDAKLFISEHPTQIEYRNGLSSTLESYFSVIRAAIDKLPERDLIYFRPTRTTGTAKFDIGDGVLLSMPLDMEMKFRCHVASSVVNDTALKETITNAIIAIVEPLIANTSISLSEIAKTIKEKIDYIESIDVLGINGDTSLQTITIAEDGVQPSIAQVLYLTKDNAIAIKKSIDVEFVIAA